MDAKHKQDIVYTHAILNTLTAGYQGRFAFFNILQQLGFSGIDQNEPDRTKRSLEKITRWNSDLWQQVCIFSTAWTKPETFDSQEAYQLLDAIKPELNSLANSTLGILNDAETPQKPQQVKYLIATFGRYAYARDNYVKGFIEYGKNFSQPNIMAEYSELLPSSSVDVETAHSFLTTYRDPAKADQKFFQVLFDECLELPGVFYTQVHDINQLMAIYKGGATFENCEFSGQEAAGWENMGFGAVAAGYWRAYNFGPNEAAAWVKAEFLNPGLAFEWRLVGFQPAIAVLWAKQNFPPEVALNWTQQGFNTEQAISYIARGIRDPKEAK